MGWFANRVLVVVLAMIALAILVITLYAIFPPLQCAVGSGASPAAGCAMAPTAG